MALSPEYLLDQSISESVAYTEFMLQYRKDENTLYCFFEGFEDRMYYSIRIKNISLCEKYRDYICGGKDQVIKVHTLIKENKYYSKVKTGFFVDRDFDNHIYPNDIYVTPTYSIENLYCNQEAFEDILKTEFKMNPADKDFDKCVDVFLNLQRYFNEQILIFNAWLACQADYRNQNGSQTRLNIDNKVKGYFDKIVSPELTKIKEFPELQTKAQLEAIFNNSPIIADEIVNKKVDEFKQVNQVERFRGKFQIRFLESFLSRLQSIFGLGSCPFENKYKCSLRLEYATICSSLSQYAKTTDCLKAYIKFVSA